MSFLNIFRKKQANPRINHIFTDEDRAQSELVKAKRRELEQIKFEIQIEKEKHNLEIARAELQRLKDGFDSSDYEEEGSDPMMGLVSVLLPLIQQHLANPQTVINNQPVAPNEIRKPMTDEEIKSIIASFPEGQVNAFKRLPQKLQKDVICQNIKTKLPQITEEEINRAITILNDGQTV